MEITCTRLFAEWFFITWLAAILGITIWTIFMGLTYKPDPSVIDMAPFKDWGAYIVGLLLGFLFYLLSPLGWVSIGFLCVALQKKIRKPLYIAAAVAFVFGLYWPTMFYNVMSI